MSSEPDPDFDTLCPRPGLRVHVHRSRRFKSVRLDVFLARLLRPREAASLALIGRLLERGTARLPGIRELNRHTDLLYGAGLSSQTEAMGPFQVLHLHYDAVDSAYLPGQPDLLASGFELLGEVLRDPCLEDGSFPVAWVDQERQAQHRSIEALYSDRTLLAQRRCLEIMCEGEAYGIAAHGDPADLADLHPQELTSTLAELAATSVFDVYVCGDLPADRAVSLAQETLGWERSGVREPPPPPSHVGNGTVRRVREADAVAQGRMMLGYRTGITLGGAQADLYPAKALLNLLLGGDVHSRLYQRVREEAGLCYHIASYTEPMGGMLFVEAGVEAGDRQAVSEIVQAQLRQLVDEGPGAVELERSRALARQRLDGFDDSRESLIRFDYYRRLARGEPARQRLREAIDGLTPEALRIVAERIELDTDYFLAPS